jgi:mono/diheme cytochrome c family protein
MAACQAEQVVVPRGEDYPPRPHFITTGDAAAGRHTFVSLQCNTCHTIAGKNTSSINTPDAGPRLGSMQARQSADDIAMSIVNPSHGISRKAGPWRENSVSRMRDYGNEMTVRQLLDVVAYIRSLNDSGAGDLLSPSR